jgi:hypothetical protein
MMWLCNMRGMDPDELMDDVSPAAGSVATA